MKISLLSDTQTQIDNILNVLLTAAERAIMLGDTCGKAGFSEYNRGQFLRLVESTVEENTGNSELLHRLTLLIGERDGQ